MIENQQRVHPNLPLPPPPNERGCEDVIYDIFSAVCFPLGLYRVASHYAGKLLAHLIVPSSYACQSFDPIRGAFTIPSPEGHELEGVKITHPESNRWLVLFCGNGGLYQEHRAFLQALSNTYEINVLQVNYRGALKPNVSAPSCFEDLVNDGRVILWHLLREGVPLQNIILNGFSLGGAVALRLGREFQLPTVVHNTFSSTNAMAESMISQIPWNEFDAGIKEITTLPHEIELNFIMRILYALKDLLLSPLELIFRTCYFAAVFFADLSACAFAKAAMDLQQIAKTIFFDALLTLTGALALVTAPWTQEILKWNADLNIAMMCENSLIITVAQKQWLYHWLLSFTGWNVNSRAEWDALQARKIAFYAPNDTVIPYQASLARDLPGIVVRLPDDADHSCRLGFDSQQFEQIINPPISS